MTRPLEVLATPTLIRAARGVYGRAIRAELLAIGFDDLPRNGAVLLAGIGNDEQGRAGLPSELGVTKQAVSQVIDILVNRGYVERTEHTDDRRRISLVLTDRGVQVTEAVVRAVDRIDAELLSEVSAADVQAMRAALIALSRIRADEVAAGTSIARPARQLRNFQPIFMVRDLTAALAHYTSLGFRTQADGGGTEYGFATRERTGLHLSTHPGHDPKHNHCSAYLYVADADALFDEWTRPGIGGETIAVEAKPWKLREGAHIDPDGNLIRFGSWIEQD